ncbi:hypothetical protein MKEN_00821000 [Mycena kentingensis (nom. inval.)]|nr:hypothetical protein MKEN_00821000 [Mycena kentingensis (nom. inval.)]
MLVNEPPPYKPLPDEAGPSKSAPPFQDNPTGLLVDLADSDSPLLIPGGEIPPPSFTIYEAECWETSSGDVVSHDSHLNSDGEALYRFLLSQSTTPPAFRLHCKGTHTETRYRHVTHRHDDGRTRTRTESYTETIVDFDFYIDASNLSGPVHWSAGDEDPVYRGAMWREIDSVEGKQKAKRAENKRYKAWIEDRSARGLPPWVSSVSSFAEGMSPNAVVLKSSKSLREWADLYCASPKSLKEFIYEKVVYGWNVRQLENAVRATIVASPYSGDLTVEFATTANKIYIRPDNRLSRLLSNKWFKFLTYLLILPWLCLWIFKRFHPRGGGTWAVCGGAYALKTWVLAEPEPERQDVKGASSLNANHGNVVRTPAGSNRLIGHREGEWFRAWQPTIVRAVSNRYNSPSPLYTTTEEGLPDAYALDGY